VFPKELAPNLFEQARYKRRMVHKELQNFNWIRNLKQLNSKTLLEEFILLFPTISEIHLSEHKDTIYWRWTGSGEYSAASAYEVQFLVHSLDSELQPFGRHSLNPNAASLLGWQYKGRHPRLTICSRRTGPALLFVPFATVKMRPMITYLLNAIFLKLFGTKSLMNFICTQPFDRSKKEMSHSGCKQFRGFQGRSSRGRQRV
jgi:hypothetical protein